MSRFAAALVADASPACDHAAVHGHQLPAGQHSEQANDEPDQGEEDEEEGILPIEFTEADARKGLLRGTPVHEIVAGAGKHWEPNSLHSEQARSWACSEPVRRNTAFISHSWKASRFLKWLALLAFFNGRAAALSSVIAAVAAVFFDYHVHIDGLRFQVPVALVDGRVLKFAFTMGPFIAGIAVGAFTFFAGHHVRRVPAAVGLLAPQSVFLDKLAIHQDDSDLMGRGIRLLGAFINTSDVFLVLLSKEYLTRLWCSYELAVFAHLKAATRFSGTLCAWHLPLVKIVLAKVIKGVLFGMSIFFYEWCLAVGFSGGDVIFLLVCYSVWFCTTIVTTAGMLELLREAGAMPQQVRTYDLRATECFNPPDRESVESAITAWFDGKSRPNAIERFNRFVREDLLACMGDAFGDRTHIDYRAAVWASLPTLFWSTLGSACNVEIGPLNYFMYVLPCIVQDIAGSMLTWAWQFRAISFIERCCATENDYAPPPEQEYLATLSNCCNTSWRPFVVHVTVCLVIDVALLTGMAQVQGVHAEQTPPAPVIVAVSGAVVLLSIFVYR